MCLSVWERASLTVHSAQDDRLDVVEIHIRRQVEVFSGTLVNLEDNVSHVWGGGKLSQTDNNDQVLGFLLFGCLNEVPAWWENFNTLTAENWAIKHEKVSRRLDLKSAMHV